MLAACKGLMLDVHHVGSTSIGGITIKHATEQIAQEIDAKMYASRSGRITRSPRRTEIDGTTARGRSSFLGMVMSSAPVASLLRREGQNLWCGYACSKPHLWNGSISASSPSSHASKAFQLFKLNTFTP